VYPLQDVRSDQHVLEIMWDVVMVKCTSQRQVCTLVKLTGFASRYPVIVAMFSSLLSSGLARTMSSR
jgi:hypothetical protein